MGQIVDWTRVEMFTLSEISNLMKVRLSTVKSAVNNGLLKETRPGNLVVARAELCRFLKERNFKEALAKLGVSEESSAEKSGHLQVGDWTFDVLLEDGGFNMVAIRSGGETRYVRIDIDQHGRIALYDTTNLDSK